MSSNADFQTQSPPAVTVKATVLPVLNYALHQNGAALVQSVTIENPTGADLQHLELRITASPAFALPFARHIDLVPGGKTITLTRPELIPDGAFLAGLTEKLRGLLTIELTCRDAVLYRDQMEVTVLAFDQWHGLGLYPELLGAFVTPNHPAVAGIIARATEFLGQWTGDTSMDAYQTQDPNRVLAQAAAIYTALKEQSIAYAVAPASFEEAGQRVRLADMVLGQKLGTCLDLTLLYAACLEAVGLHPLLITTPGHIFTGLWLEQKMFPECVQDDAALLTKRLAAGINEIAVAETTCLTSGRNADFDAARRLGEQNLTAKQVEYIIDLRRARLSGVSPLPLRIATAEGWTLEQADRKHPAQAAPQWLEETRDTEAAVPEAAIPRKAQWERKLLDLGLRNTLINLRMTRTQLPILISSLDEIENALAEGREFSILPRPADWKGEDPSFEALRDLGTDPVIRAEFDNNRLRSLLTAAELTAAVKGLYRTAKTALEENGANTLYLALGMLRWYESGRSTKARYAPIILLPIELVRKSAAQGYVLRLRDEDAQMNITLLEKLKQDFGIQVQGTDPLPLDDHGVDIRRVLTILRKAVMDQPRWDVVESACIGIFSFSQFVMWNDIRSRTDDLMNNKVVRSLMEGKLCWDAQPLEIGARVSEDNVLLPMAADASQLHAIRAACSGESFVLHGPPGTGKSQTITSLIANALAQGKSVLFVAEKMAALQVVQKRLDSIGIGPFCLELHSNKSKKKAVLEQLRQASEVTKRAPAQAYAHKAEQLSKLRRQLDSYAEALHKPQRWGSDLFALINEYECFREARGLRAFDPGFVSGLTAAALEDQRMAVEQLTAAGREAGHPSGHPLALVGCTQYTQSLRSGLQTAVEAYKNQLTAVRPFVEALASRVEGRLPRNAGEFGRLEGIAGALACWYDLPPQWAKPQDPDRYFDAVKEMAGRFQKAAELEGKLLQVFRPDLLTQDGTALFAEFVEVSGKWFLPKMLGMNKLTRQLNVFALAPVDKAALRQHIETLRDQQTEQKAGQALLDVYGKDLGGFFHGRDTDWANIAALADTARESGRILEQLFGNGGVLRTYAADPGLKEAVFGVQNSMAALKEAKAAFDGLLCPLATDSDDWMGQQISLCDAVLDHSHRLREWTAYAAAAAAARELGLGNVICGYESGLAHEEVLPAYKKALLESLIAAAIDESDSLNRFSGAVFNKKIDQLRQLYDDWADLSRQEVYCRLAAKVPDFTREAAHSSELGILQRNIRSGGRGTSIRRLFDQIPNLLPRLCPCMLMSPISAAQYLDPSRTPFDIVVFDEASQLPTCKAVGVLARGKNAVIVGDPKQMPPTSFFSTNTVDEENLEAEDLESILDDCLALNMPQTHLLWHYRSRHESLIAFSNSHFYENKLLTFPSVNDRESKVRLIPVEGVFERGKSRRNRAEADAVVAELSRRCHDPQLSKQSVGVVTFNISQQNLIDDLLSEACTRDQDLEKWAFGSEEPVFIKNLENVQGDERDVILFSVGYGPDEQGKVYMNFGPLNRDGGWRRLNVAVTRARQEMVVFSTLRADQIDLNRTRAEGVAALKDFLDYAAGRTLALDEASIQKEQDAKDGVAAAICQALEAEGYETDRQVGRSEYRIDIGVADPEKPDRYLLGIMLDGDAYGAAKTTRDREIAQTGVLNGLGWDILRLWSMDWWDNREKEIKRILTRLKEAKKAQKQPPREAPPQEAPAEPVRLEQNAPQPEPAQAVSEAPEYRAAVLQQEDLTAEEFTEPKYVRSIEKKLRQIIAAEAPISAALLTRRLVQSFGISRAGSRIQAHLTGILGRLGCQTTAQGETLFYWEKKQSPEEYLLFRVSGDEENRREAKDVPQEEAANAVCAVLYEQVSMNAEDLLRETAKKLGYTRLGGNVLTALEAGIAYARARAFIAPGSNDCFVLSDLGMARAEARQK